jgi:hypothetical protein
MDSLIPPSSSSAPTTSLVSFVSEMKALVDHLLSPQVSTLVSRSVFAHLGQSLLERLPRQGKYACSEEQLQALQDVAEYALEQGGSHTQAFEEADTSVREFLFEHLKAQGCYRSAASVLAGMNMDASTRPLSEDAKADIYVKIAETFLVEDQAVEAVTDYWVQVGKGKEREGGRAGTKTALSPSSSARRALRVLRAMEAFYCTLLPC